MVCFPAEALRYDIVNATLLPEGRELSGLYSLERYQEGQYQEVWNELVQLGPTIFEDQFYPNEQKMIHLKEQYVPRIESLSRERIFKNVQQGV